MAGSGIGNISRKDMPGKSSGGELIFCAVNRNDDLCDRGRNDGSRRDDDILIGDDFLHRFALTLD